MNSPKREVQEIIILLVKIRSEMLKGLLKFFSKFNESCTPHPQVVYEDPPPPPLFSNYTNPVFASTLLKAVGFSVVVCVCVMRQTQRGIYF